MTACSGLASAASAILCALSWAVAAAAAAAGALLSLGLAAAACSSFAASLVLGFVCLGGVVCTLAAAAVAYAAQLLRRASQVQPLSVASAGTAAQQYMPAGASTAADGDASVAVARNDAGSAIEQPLKQQRVKEQLSATAEGGTTGGGHTVLAQGPPGVKDASFRRLSVHACDALSERDALLFRRVPHLSWGQLVNVEPPASDSQTSGPAHQAASPALLVPTPRQPEGQPLRSRSEGGSPPAGLLQLLQLPEAGRLV